MHHNIYALFIHFMSLHIAQRMSISEVLDYDSILEFLITNWSIPNSQVCFFTYLSPQCLLFHLHMARYATLVASDRSPTYCYMNCRILAYSSIFLYFQCPQYHVNNNENLNSGTSSFGPIYHYCRILNNNTMMWKKRHMHSWKKLHAIEKRHSAIYEVIVRRINYSAM